LWGARHPARARPLFFGSLSLFFFFFVVGGGGGGGGRSKIVAGLSSCCCSLYVAWLMEVIVDELGTQCRRRTGVAQSVQ